MTIRTAITTAIAAALTGTITGLAAQIGGCAPLDITPDPTPPPAVAADLAALPVRPEDTRTPYERDQWGDWTTHSRGCDTREIVLTDQGHGTRPGTACRPVCPAHGPACWHSPYDGARLRDPRRVHVDHRVPLAEAHRSGAAGWTDEQRERFANDPANLVAASARSNTSKGDQDPAHWRGAVRTEWCGYATGYVTTKDTYSLSVDAAERDALAAMLATC